MTYQQVLGKSYTVDTKVTEYDECETMQKNLNNFNKLEKKSNTLFNWWSIKVIVMNDDFNKCYNACLVGYSEFCNLNLK